MKFKTLAGIIAWVLIALIAVIWFSNPDFSSKSSQEALEANTQAFMHTNLGNGIPESENKANAQSDSGGSEVPQVVIDSSQPVIVTQGNTTGCPDGQTCESVTTSY